MATWIKLNQVAVLAVVLTAASAHLGLAQENALTEQEVAQGYILLFDGETLDGWATTGNPEGWAVQDGAIVNLRQGGGYLHTVDRWGNFVLCLDFMVDPGTNSGVFFRWQDLGNDLTGIEMQVLDSAGREAASKYDCGAIYDIVAPWRNMMKPPGEWNSAQIVCLDSLVFIHLNGEPICGLDLSRWTQAGQNPDGSANKFPIAYAELVEPGYIGLQDHGSPVWYRSIRIKPLEAAGGSPEE